MSLQKTGLLSCRGQTGFNALFIKKLMNRLYWSKIYNPGAEYCQQKLNSFSNFTCEEGNMEKIYEEKNILREAMKTKLATLTTEDKNRQSEIVKQKLFSHDVYKRSKRVSVFLNMDDEVQTLDILKDLFEKQKIVFIPRYSGKLGRMDMVKLDSWLDYENLPLTRWNIKQPAMSDPRENAIETGGLDLTIMPGLAFTKTGCRLGRGKGYYDAFLTRYANLPNGKPYTIAVAFKEQVLPHIPVTDKDVIIDEVLSAN